MVNLPDPKPAVAARNDGGPPVLPTVPDDVVREISSLLGFKDRLALSLASHHIHQVVKPRVEEVVIDESKLPALHGWVFRDPAVRASQLRVLDIAPAKSEDSPHVRQFLEIIKKATNIHTLRCSRPLSVAIWMQNLPAFTHLRHLQLRGCTLKMLESLRLPDTLTELHLSHPPPETVFVFRRILLALSYLQALTTLTLEGLTLPDPDDEEGDDDDNDGNADEDDEDEDGDVDEDGNADVDDDDENEDAVEDEDAAEDAAEDDDEGGDGDGDEGDGDGGNPAETSTTSAPVLTSVHTLNLLEMELPPSVDWATAFPALKTVVLEDAMHFDMDAYATTPLHHLVVSGPFENLVPWCVNRLTYVPGFAARDGILLEDICDASYLVTLSLKLLYMSSSVLDAVVNNASDIHLLEIECLGTVLSEVIWVCVSLPFGCATRSSINLSRRAVRAVQDRLVRGSASAMSQHRCGRLALSGPRGQRTVPY